MGELKRFSAIDVPLEEISTYAAMVHEENLSSKRSCLTEENLQYHLQLAIN